MKEEELKNLLDKYYKGVTSLAEETALRNYFSGENISSEYDPEKAIFNGISELLVNEEPSDGLELKIIRNIDILNSRSGFKSRRVFYILSTAAAVIIMLIGSYFLFINNSDFKDTYSDPEIAYNEAIKILKEVSAKLNKGTEGLKSITTFSSMTEASFRYIEGSASMIRENLLKLEIIDIMSLNVPDNQ
jgi:hypothetical protein